MTPTPPPPTLQGTRCGLAFGLCTGLADHQDPRFGGVSSPVVEPSPLPDLVQWFVPPHSLALEVDECAEAIEAVRDRAGAVSDAHGFVPLPRIARRFMCAANAFAGRDRYTSPPLVGVHHYRPGEHSPWHEDGQPVDGKRLANDRLSVLAQLSEPDAYEGGSLLFRITADVTLEAPRASGTVVVFRADTRHSVRPISRGHRYSAVSFMHDRKDGHHG